MVYQGKAQMKSIREDLTALYTMEWKQKANQQSVQLVYRPVSEVGISLFLTPNISMKSVRTFGKDIGRFDRYE